GAFALGLAGCNGNGTTSAIKADPLAADMLADFSKGSVAEIFGSDGWTNGGNFDCVWSAGNLTYSEGKMHLAIKDEKKSAWIDGASKEFDHTGAEARTHHHYGYGDFEVRMKPTDVVGSVSSFFTCTGNYDTVNGVPNPWDEVDIEFLGKDTTHVQFNYFVNGVGGHEHMHDLGFDASKEFHNYGYRWSKDAITWFVDGNPVYQVTASDRNPLPATPGRIMTNYWPSSAVGWSGKYSGSQNKTTDYEWIKAKASTMYIDGEGDPVVSSVDSADSQAGDAIDWSAIDPVDLSFTTEAEEYRISKADGVTTVTYDAIPGQSYRTINANITDAAAGKNAVKMTLKNAGNVADRVRANLIDPALAGQQNMASNISATMNGAPVYTDTTWGGSFFEIPAGETVEAVVVFGGAPNSLEFMIDSSCADNETRAGTLEISDIKFGGKAEAQPVASSEEPAPVESEDQSAEESDGVALTFGGNEAYTITPSGTPTTSVEVTYAAVTGQSYVTLGAPVASVANGKNTLALDVENKGADLVKFRVDILGTTQVENTKAINTNAWADGHNEVYTDTNWGGSFISVAVGEKVTFTVVYDESTERGAADYMNFFVDSATDNNDSHAGDIVVSNFRFTAAA
nr:family 16 glycosylhydrolase [Bacilli bacterium]